MTIETVIKSVCEKCPFYVPILCPLDEKEEEESEVQNDTIQ